MESFDLAAKEYDAQFSHTRIGKVQRSQVWERINKIDLHENSSILEINCGTGEDANVWFSKKHQILATDISKEMIGVAKNKFPHIQFKQLDINAINTIDTKFDIVFSNFGGLNCLSKNDLSKFILQTKEKLTKDGKLIMVIMGKKCIWDNLFLFIKGNWKQLGRRNTNLPLDINVDGQNVYTWYYSPKQITNIASEHFNFIAQSPIGLHIPPSYLSKFFRNKPITVAFLAFLDKVFSFSFLSDFSDHYFITFSKKD